MKKWVIGKVLIDLDTNRSEFGSIINILLANRGINEEEREEFLNPPGIKYYFANQPTEFKQSLKKAREEILSAVRKNIPIIIHGDYDADGICATAILYKTLTKTLNYSRVLYFIPNRFDHGYGLSEDSVREIDRVVEEQFPATANEKKTEKSHKETAEKGLVITVDCGITAEDRVLDSAHGLGYKVLITDHHQKSDKEPKADVLLWNDGMSGAGVALMLSLALGLKDEQLVSLAGIATVTDLIPLKGFNRSLVKKTLSILNSNPPLGIKKLVEASGRTNGELTTYDLGYIIGPRLNASGRLDSAYDSLKLLLEEDPQNAEVIAQKLNATNSERQEVTQKMYEFAESLYIETGSGKLIVVKSEQFHEGVIGLVAGKLAQKYYKPTIAISLNGDTAKGSVRSVAGVDIINFLRHYHERFISLGGHPMAAGFSVRQHELENLIADLNALANELISEDILEPRLVVDLELPISLISVDLLKHIERLKPYGMGNPEPVFVSRNISVVGSDFVGKDASHLSLRLFDGKRYYKAIFFDAKNLGISGFNFGDNIDIAYTASLKTYNGEDRVELIIKDIKHTNERS